MPTPSDRALTAEWAEFYRMRGFNPLPSREDAKRPLVRFAQWWDVPTPTDLFQQHPTANVQLMTGRRWRLLVIDLDGPEARERWARLGRTPRTWVTHSGGNGHHLWFRLPTSYSTPLHKAFLWKGDGEHQAIERLCDLSLVMAPPSIHPTTGERYRFLSRNQSPARLPMPADCPSWVLSLAPVVTTPAPVIVPRPAPRRIGQPTGRYDWRDVRDAITDKIGLARSWGVRVTGRPSAKGWASCHAIDRDDRHPSAAIHAGTGRYCDLGSGLRLSFFDLSVQLGVYRDFREAVADLANRYHVKSSA